MEKLLRPNQTKSTKPKVKKPVKVVYISNPMKVKTSASEFRALVQELTGQDSDMSGHDSTPLPNLHDVQGSHEKVSGSDVEASVLNLECKVVQGDNARICSGSDVANYEGYGSSVFDMGQVMGTGLYCSSDLWC